MTVVIFISKSLFERFIEAACFYSPDIASKYKGTHKSMLLIQIDSGPGVDPNTKPADQKLITLSSRASGEIIFLILLIGMQTVA